MNRILFILLGVWVGYGAYAEQAQKDTIQTYLLDEVVVTSSHKETNSLKKLPGSISFIPSQTIETQKISGIKDLSAMIPNLFIPDYGSKLSVPVYIRGIGERSTGQSIGMYVDNMPLLDKSAFDFELTDIRRIEVLRGPQGTLYGRNAMGGMINVSTASPLRDQYTKFLLSAGNNGLFKAKAATSQLLSQNAGLSINAYYDRNDGYFTNQYSGEKVDQSQSEGARMRLDWKMNRQWTAQLSANYDHTDQGAFPYGLYENGKIAEPNYNTPGKYKRDIIAGNINLSYTDDLLIFNLNTGFQYLKDDMKMDVDNDSVDMFRLNQLQNEKSWTGELTIKSNTKSNYQWLFGLFEFYSDLKTDVITTVGAHGIATILQPAFDKIHQNNPRAPMMTIKNTEIPIPGTFNILTCGGAVFHQSTYNNLFIDGLSLTAGLRLDYEKPRLEYNTGTNMDLSVDMQAGPNVIHLMDSALVTTLQGNKSTHFTEILPKIALKYEFNPDSYVYATVSNGYKTGGYNIQNFADIVQDALREKYDRTFHASSIDSVVPYQPESSWNYEIGFKGELIKDVLYTEIAGFYIDVNNIQITDFVASGQGRILKNAGKARSLGLDLSLTAQLIDGLNISANYGFTKATFSNYKTSTVDYTGKYIPFAPQNTFSVNVAYRKNFQDKWIDRCHLSALYNGAGRIYWTEANDVCQHFYGLLNLHAGVNKGIFGLNLWAKNLFDTRYAAFYFESMQRQLAQQGRPLQFGADLVVAF